MFSDMEDPHGRGGQPLHVNLHVPFSDLSPTEEEKDPFNLENAILVDVRPVGEEDL